MSDKTRQQEEEERDRRYRRVAVRTAVRISTIDPETDPSTGRPYFRTSEETCANVSRGGAYVETDDAISPGRRVLLEVDLPEGDRLQTVGRVAWTKTALQPAEQGKSSGMGIEFVGASPEELGRLERFLDATHGTPPETDAEPASKTTQLTEGGATAETLAARATPTRA